MREWTYGEIEVALNNAGFDRVMSRYAIRGVNVAVPLRLFKVFESLVQRLPRRARLVAARILLHDVFVVAQ